MILIVLEIRTEKFKKLILYKMTVNNSIQVIKNNVFARMKFSQTVSQVRVVPLLVSLTSTEREVSGAFCLQSAVVSRAASVKPPFSGESVRKPTTSACNDDIRLDLEAAHKGVAHTLRAVALGTLK